MSDTRIQKVLFSAILAVAIAQCVHDFQRLPDRLASHFAISGMPNGWMLKTHFFMVYALMVLSAAVVGFWVPGRIAKTDGNRLNMPNKKYWLAPERRAATFAYFEQFFAWYSCVLLLLEVCAMGLAMHANFDASPRLPTGPIVTAIIAFLSFNVAAITAMFRRFSRPL